MTNGNYEEVNKYHNKYFPTNDQATKLCLLIHFDFISVSSHMTWGYF